jgi:5-methylcytosine-specific restriction endonuclease McrA
MAGYGYQNKNGFWFKVTVNTLSELKGIPKRCAFCRDTYNLTIDHKLEKSKHPKARGFLANYQILCEPCNQKKSNRHAKKTKNMLKFS